ncbi:MAG: RidA family protein [Phycisphaerae bacterium]|nr:RidA family protein [Gemmatimonadaceae bacterium]
MLSATASLLACEPPENNSTAAETSTAKAAVAEPEFIKAKSGPVRPFSQAVRANGFLILSGQIGTDSSGNLVAGGIKPETRQTMDNIKKVLEENGSSMDRVVKCTVFLADMKEWGTVNEIYVTYFDPARRPARSAMGANGLALGSQVEIECLAVDR